MAVFLFCFRALVILSSGVTACVCVCVCNGNEGKSSRVNERTLIADEREARVCIGRHACECVQKYCKHKDAAACTHTCTHAHAQTSTCSCEVTLASTNKLVWNTGKRLLQHHLLIQALGSKYTHTYRTQETHTHKKR